MVADRPKSALPLELVPSDIARAAKYKSAIPHLLLRTSATALYIMPSAETKPKTLYDKVFDHHVVNEQEDGTCLLYIGMPRIPCGWLLSFPPLTVE